MLTNKIISSAHCNRKDRVLIVGATDMGKTSLAFRIAYEAAELGGCPLYICNKAKIEAKLPLNVHVSTGGTEMMRMSPDVLSRIHMKYVTSMNELKAVISGMHCFSPLPTTLIIDDLSLLIDPLHSVPRNDPKFLDICLSIGAYTDDVLNFLAQKESTTSNNNDNNHTRNTPKIQLLITDSCDESAFLHIMQKTTPNVSKLVKSSSGEHSLVSVTDQRTARGSDSRVILSKIECAQSVLNVSL